MIAGQPTLDEVKALLRLEDEIDDVYLQLAVNGVASRQEQRLNFPLDDQETPAAYYPDDLKQAFFLRVARLLDRRNSPTGLVGFADYGPAMIARTDVDAADLEAPYLKVLVG